jgi:hypothetical protein
MIAGLMLAALAYTGVGDGVTDNTATFNAAVAQVCASTTTRTLYMPAGKYRFGSPPNAIPCALNLVGEGKAVTWLIRDYSGMGEYFLKIIGGQDTYGGGSIRDLAIYTSPNGIGGIAIWVLPSPDVDPTVLTKNPHGLLIDNVQIAKWSTAGGSWAFGIYLDGTHNPGPGAIGARAIAIRNTSVSSFTVYPVYLNMAYGTRMTEVDAYIALGGGQYLVGCTNSSNTTLTSGTLTVSGC